MKRLKAIMLLLPALALLHSAPSYAVPCTPRGFVGPPGNYFDHIANGEPASTSCWAPVNAIFVTGQTSCGPFSPSYNAFQFNYGSSVSQQFTVPTNSTSTYFDLIFTFDFLNGHNDGFNGFNAELWDLTTGTLLRYYSHFGDQTDLACQRVDLVVTQSLAGHTIQVRFTGQKGYSDTFIRVHGITFAEL